jgi:hypothetical protein
MRIKESACVGQASITDFITPGPYSNVRTPLTTLSRTGMRRIALVVRHAQLAPMQ